MRKLIQTAAGKTTTTALVVIVFLLQSINGIAQWSSNSYVNNQVCTADQNQGGPVICSDGNGGAIMAWVDDRNGWSDVYAQHFDSNGIALWAINGIPICTAASLQAQLAIVSDGNGGAIITWDDFRNEIDPDIYAQRINGNGESLWTANGVAICIAPDEQTYPQIISDGNGGAIITWTDWRNRESTGQDIFAQGINADGTLKWSEVIVCAINDGQGQPALASDGKGGAILVWQDGRNASDGTSAADLYAQRIDSNGSLKWLANGVSICHAFRQQTNPRLVSDGSGGAIITWQDERNLNNTYPSNIDIYAQRINSNGVAQWTNDGVVICNNTDIQEFEQITPDGAGGAVIAWEHVSGTGVSTTTKVYVQRINSSGTALWANNGIPVGSGGTFPQIVSDSTGGGILVWEKALGSGLTDVYAQHIDANGLEQWMPYGGIVVSNAYGTQTNLQFIFDNNYGTTVAWTDFRNTILDVYAQHIQTDGSLGGGNAIGSQIITFNPIPAIKYSDGTFIPDAIASSSLGVTFTSSDTTVAKWSGSYFSITGVGTSTITAYQSGNANYTAAIPVSQDLVVEKGIQYINFSPINSKTLGDAPFILNASAGSLLPVDFSSISTKINLNGNEVTLLEAGSVTIFADQPGDITYEAAQTAAQVFCINPPQPTIVSGMDKTTLISDSPSGNKWYKDGTIIPGQVNDTLLTTESGIYTVRVIADICYSLSSNGINPFGTGPSGLFVAKNQDENILVYPNPVNNELTIDLSRIGKSSECKILLTDLSGREILSVIGKDIIKMNVSTLSSSVYLLKIYGNNQITIKRFVKQ
jgi:hypothetical protein